MTFSWKDLIVGQFEFYWDVHLRRRLDGLTDEEYLWEPVPGAASIRPDASGVWTMDPTGTRNPPPVTTIAWRMMHIAAAGWYNRASAFFSDDPFPDLDMNDPGRQPKSLPGTASEAITFFDDAYHRWHDGIAALDDEAVVRPLGPKGGEYADDTMAHLIVHINRETMHHGGEIGVLRDLYRAGLR